MATNINCEIKEHEDKLKQLKDEVQRTEFNLKMLKNSASNNNQRKRFRRINKKERELTHALICLEDKAKEHGSTIFKKHIKTIKNVMDEFAREVKGLRNLWYFNNEYLVKDLGINQNPTTTEEALAILPKLGFNWPPKQQINMCKDEVPFRSIPLKGNLVEWSSLPESSENSERNKLTLSTETVGFLTKFQNIVTSQRMELFQIGEILNCLSYHLDPYNPRLTERSILLYKNKKKELFCAKATLKNTSVSLKKTLNNLEKLFENGTKKSNANIPQPAVNPINQSEVKMANQVSRYHTSGPPPSGAPSSSNGHPSCKPPSSTTSTSGQQPYPSSPTNGHLLCGPPSASGQLTLAPYIGPLTYEPQPCTSNQRKRKADEQPNATKRRKTNAPKSDYLSDLLQTMTHTLENPLQQPKRHG